MINFPHWNQWMTCKVIDSSPHLNRMVTFTAQSPQSRFFPSSLQHSSNVSPHKITLHHITIRFTTQQCCAPSPNVTITAKKQRTKKKWKISFLHMAGYRQLTNKIYYWVLFVGSLNTSFWHCMAKCINCDWRIWARIIVIVVVTMLVYNQYSSVWL